MIRGLKIALLSLALFHPDAHSGDLNNIVSLGNKSFKMGNYSSAERLYFNALAVKQDSMEVNFNYACALYKQERYDHALKYFHKAFEKSDFKQKSKVYFNAGNTYFKLGQVKKAADMYKEALRFDPKDEAARHNLTLCIIKQNEAAKEEERLTMEEAQTPETDEGTFLAAVSEQEDQKPAGTPEQKVFDVPSRTGGMPEVQKSFASQYKSMTRAEMEKLLKKVEKDDLDILKEYWRTKINHSGGPVSKGW